MLHEIRRLCSCELRLMNIMERGREQRLNFMFRIKFHEYENVNIRAKYQNHQAGHDIFIIIFSL